MKILVQLDKTPNLLLQEKNEISYSRTNWNNKDLQSQVKSSLSVKN